MIRKQCTILVAIFAMLAIPNLAQAQYPWGCFGGYAGGWAYGSGYTYGTAYVAPPPYFALFPPVYYSGQIVRRPYGSSPFAYPSWYERSSIVPAIAAAPAPQPQLIENPYVKGDNDAAASRRRVVTNPFVLAQQ